MAAAYSGVHGTGGGTGSSGSVATGSITTTTGGLLVVVVSWDNSAAATISSVTGGGTGITWTIAIAKTNDARHGQATQVYIGTGYASATGAVTANFSPTTGFRSIMLFEVTGQDATQLDGGANVGFNIDVADVGTAVDTTSITPATDACLIGAWVNDVTGGSMTITKDAAYTQIDNFDPWAGGGNGQHQTQYRTSNLSPAAAHQANWTFGAAHDADNVVVAVRPAGGGGGGASVVPILMRQYRQRWS